MMAGMDYDHYNNNNTDSSYMTVPQSDTQIEDYIVPSILAIVGIVGILANAALLYILRKTDKNKPENTFIFSLAVADILVLLFYLPFTTTISFSFGVTVCKFVRSINDISTTVSAFIIVALIVHSFFGGSDATAIQPNGNGRRDIIAVVVIWVLAVVSAVPAMMFSHISTYDGEEITYCTTLEPEYQIVEPLVKFIAVYAIPLTAVVVCCCVAKRSAKVSSRRDARSEDSNLAIVLVVVYAICFFPTNLLNIWVFIPINESDFWMFIDETSYYFDIAYRCLNPLALYCASGAFRQLFNRYLVNWCSSRNRESVPDAARNRKMEADL